MIARYYLDTRIGKCGKTIELWINEDDYKSGASHDIELHRDAGQGRFSVVHMSHVEKYYSILKEWCKEYGIKLEKL